MRTTTGDSAKSINTKAGSLLNLAIVTQAQLASAADPINIYMYSEKQKGAVVGVTMTTGGALALAIAQGSDPTSKWNIVGDTAATPVTSVTPA
ncbi:putative acetyl-CoA acetyltransferase [Ralstonia phage Reminis]|uniref:Putative acetyl-CoA acetyltransferase n=1 Tax=Ralstonia phage Reminis TaxID=2662139 RepID=A0A5Q2UBZ9_9CAUD|nr:putative acetyl-CoA acetyltransferase [Ralstonia phage Reminis]